MKHLLLITLISLLFGGQTFSQGACANNIKIESPVVTKPTEGGIVSATCSTLVVQWKGSTGQTYEVKGTYKDPETNEIKSTAPATNLSCNSSYVCNATIPVTAGTMVSWSVQAMSVIDGRTFYSYPLRGQESAISGCKAPATANPGIVSTEEIPLKAEAYPNPVRTTFHINLSSTANSSVNKVVIRIFDVEGRAVMVKDALWGNVQINVRGFSSGTYFAHVENTEGKVLHKIKFIKE